MRPVGDPGADVPDPPVRGCPRTGADDTVTVSPSVTTWTTCGTSTGSDARTARRTLSMRRIRQQLAERVCSRTDIGTISTPSIGGSPGTAWPAGPAAPATGVRVVLRRPRCGRRGGCPVWARRLPTWTRFLIDPVLGVVPRGGGQDRWGSAWCSVSVAWVVWVVLRVVWNFSVSSVSRAGCRSCGGARSRACR